MSSSEFMEKDGSTIVAQSDNLRLQATRLGLSEAQLVEMCRTMCIIRQFESMADRLFTQNKVHGTMHLSIGQEAVAVGTANAVRPTDYQVNHHRGHGHFIAKGADLKRMMAEFLGKDTGYCRGRGGSMHIADLEANNLGANGIVGGGLPLAVGAGLALQLQGRPEIIISLFGDGATNQGVFHESLNMAALWKLPIVFVCENNHYGMSMAVERSTACLPIAKRAEAYGIPGHHVDGNDLLSVYEAIQGAADHARSGRGPVLVEAETYRWMGHSKSDRNVYRTREEIEGWKARDPIKRFRIRLVDAEILTGWQADQIDQEAQQVVEDALAFAEASPEPSESSIEDWVYA